MQNVAQNSTTRPSEPEHAEDTPTQRAVRSLLVLRRIIEELTHTARESLSLGDPARDEIQSHACEAIHQVRRTENAIQFAGGLREVVARAADAGEGDDEEESQPVAPDNIVLRCTNQMTSDADSIREDACAMFFITRKLVDLVPIEYEEEAHALTTSAGAHLAEITAACGYLDEVAKEALEESGDADASDLRAAAGE